MKKNLYVLFLILLFFLRGFAGTTGKIAGRVIDASTGEGLPNANIVITSVWFDDVEVDLAQKLGAVSDLDGNFTILNVPPGVYTVVAKMIGYSSVRITKVNVNIDLTTRLDFKLTEESIKGQEVVVVAEKPIIRADITSSQASVSTEQITAMPSEQFSDIVELKAGIVVGADGSMHIRGGRSNEINFMVDGISVTDPYASNFGANVENSAIQELQVISGTFNAEYGQAMSGVINIVTKDGDYNRYNFDINLSGGDYVSSHKKTFLGIDNVNPFDIRDITGVLSGPIIKGKLSFFSTLRYYYNDGYLYGKRKYRTDSYEYNADSSTWVLRYDDEGNPLLGDNKIVPLEYSEKLSGQFKLSYLFTPMIKFTFNTFITKNEYTSYSHKFKYNPDGDYKYFRDNINFIFTMDHTLNPKTFYTLKYSHLYNYYRYYAHKDPEDTTYYHVDPKILSDFFGYKFYISGTRMGHFYRKTNSDVFKFDITSQLTKIHQVKTGFELKFNELFMEEYSILLSSNTNWKPVIPSPENGYLTTTSYNTYTRRPKEYSFYVQDKIELKDLILNIGLRYEIFDPAAKVIVDLEDPNIYAPIKPEHKAMSLEERKKIWYKDASVKHQLSPRLGLAYPITDKGVIHCSYGHFLQIPPYYSLYLNPDFEVPAGFSSSSFLGNPDLKPQQTVQYEIGLQQQIGSDIGIDITGFYKDIRNLLGAEIHNTFGGSDKYLLYKNLDYGNVRGITFSLTKRATNYFSASVDYTFSIAEGNESNPTEQYINASSGIESVKQLIYLDWDQRHTLNVNLTFGDIKNWSLSLLGKYGSGLPYTPQYQGKLTAFKNSERKPAQFNVDLKFYKYFKLSFAKIGFFLNIYNLFDRKNEIFVYDDTGRATYSLISVYTPEDQGYNTLSEYLLRPDYFSPPRQVKFGISLKF